jgi:hypothetical protein
MTDYLFGKYKPTANDNWKKQQRDKLGRFLSYDGTRNQKYIRSDIEKAFLAGLNAKVSSWRLPSQIVAAYMRSLDDNT